MVVPNLQTAISLMFVCVCLLFTLIITKKKILQFHYPLVRTHYTHVDLQIHHVYYVLSFFIIIRRKQYLLRNAHDNKIKFAQCQYVESRQATMQQTITRRLNCALDSSGDKLFLKRLERTSVCDGRVRTQDMTHSIW